MATRVLLVYPPCLDERVHGEDAASVPIGLYYIAALLITRGYEVEVVNGQLLKGRPYAFRKLLKTRRPDIVGFSILQANRWGGVEMAGTVKDCLPRAVTVFGGVGASYLWRHFLTRFNAIDLVVIGEGEEPFLSLARWVDAGKRLSALGAIQGIAYRNDGLPVRTECPPLLADLDALPNPADHFTFSHLALTRGCPANCRFCGSPDYWGRRVRYHSPGYFVNQMERLHRKGVGFFYVSDDTFTASKRRAVAVCREILKRGLSVAWSAISRVDAVDAETLGWMRRAGCIQISYGVESGNSKIRRRLGKTFTDEQVARAFRDTLRHGILPRAYFIYGCPGESRETIQETLDLIRKTRPLSVVFYILSLFPGTALYREFCERTGATDDIWSAPIETIPYFETDPALTQSDVLGFGNALRGGFHRMLPELVGTFDLVEDEAFSSLHADFLSRLGMTFHRGEYARPEIIDNHLGIARRLYERALDYAPHPRAYLGLGMLAQEAGDFDAARGLLTQGHSRFPDDVEVAVCLAVNAMNTGRFDSALAVLTPIETDDRAGPLAAECRRRLSSPA